MINNKKMIDSALVEIFSEDGAKADAAAKTFVAKLRALNGSGLILPIELDAADSPINLDEQVKMIRQNLPLEMDAINKIKSILEETKASEIQAAVDSIPKQFADTVKLNTELQELPLLNMMMAHIADLGSKIQIQLNNGRVITGDVVVGLILDPNKIVSDLERQREMLEKLSTFSALVDPDTVGR